MGIKSMNRYLMQQCKNGSIEKKPLSFLSNKTIVIDTSIYLYKYRSKEALHENFYSMISLFHKYNIVPIFVFDGKPPVEKLDTIRERKVLKNEAKNKYDKLNETLNEINDNDTELRDNILYEMDKLKRQFVKISNKDVNSVKEIMNAFGVKYYEADGEADKVCAYLTLTKCYACVSDDMDMFVYGCKYIVRHMSLINQTILLYKTDEILKELNLTFPMFKQISVLSGTDYNIHDNNVSLIETLKWYREFIKNVENDGDFYKWLSINTKYINNYNSLLDIHNMYNFDNINHFELNTMDISLDNNYNKFELENIMKKYGFIFV
tara:strand:+ start:907 stop:1869 length:963 start_codon:yes stop_codon:yes gene_type:complete